MPEELDEKYNQPLQEAFQFHLRSPEGGKASMYNKLEEDFASLVEVVSEGDGPTDTNERLENALEAYTQASVSTIESAQEQGRQKVEDAHASGYAAAAAAASVSVPDWTPNSSVDPYERAPFSGNVETFVRASIEEEVSYFQRDLKYIRKYVSEDEYARAVGQVLTRGNPDIKQRLARRGIDLDDFDSEDLIGDAKQIFQNTKRMGSPDIRGILEEIDPEDLSRTNPQLFERVKRNGTDALPRIMDEVAKDLAVQSPAINAVSWTLSSRHGSLESSPDECDFLASQNPHGLGPGLYKPTHVPSHPHPSCECRTTARTMDPEEWGSDQVDTPSAPNVEEDVVRSVLQDVKDRMQTSGRTLTDNHVQRVRERIEEVVSQVYDNPRS